MNACGLENGRGTDLGVGAVALEIGNEIGHGKEEYRINAADATAFMRLEKLRPRRHYSTAMEAAERIRRWMNHVLEDRGMTPPEWAKLAGVAPSTIQRAIKPDYQFTTSSKTLAKLASAVGIDLPAIEESSSAAVGKERPKFLPIRYEVGAGIWRSVDDVQSFYGAGPVQSDPDFAGFDQWLERVVTDSMDKEYAIGTLLHVIDSRALGYAPRTGDHVIVERRRDGGMCERTVKEVIVTPAGVEFWPRSNNPKWSGPILLGDGREDDFIEVEIVGFVVGSYRSRK